MRRLIEILVVCFAVAIILVAAYAAVHGQERDASYPQTRYWAIDAKTAFVTVIDTAGVCLYVAANGFGKVDAIATVPKTQLPTGTGCQ